MQKIQIEICCGTTCYMLGGSALLKLDQYLPEEWRDYVDISAMPCTNQCDLPQNLGGAPYVRIDGELMSAATIDMILEKIGERVNASAGATDADASNLRKGAGNE